MKDSATHIRKILQRNALLTVLEERRQDGLTVVQCHGCFDIVHPGHLRYLEFASRQGDILVVTVTGDSQINKGDQRPYIPEELRAESLAALEFVDYVCVDRAPTAVDLLRAVKPDVYVKGREYETSDDPRFLAERSEVEAYGGRVIFSSGDVVFSSSELIASLPRDKQLAAQRLKLICQRHDLEQASLLNVVSRFRGMKVAVLGDVIVDRYVSCDAVDVASESPMLSLLQLSEQEYLGGAAIVARHAAAMGAHVTLVSNVARDQCSARVNSILASEGVELAAVKTRPHLVHKTRYLVEENKIFKVEHGENTPLDSHAEKNVSAILERLSRDVDVAIICDFGYGAVNASLLSRVLPCLRANVPVLAGDVSGSRGNLLNYRHVDLLCPTERELRTTLHDFESGLSSVAYELINQNQARHILCTLGKRGLVVFERPSQDPRSEEWGDRLLSEHFPSFANSCLDRLGCGDAMLTVASMSLAAGASLVGAAYLGNAASAIEIACLGNNPIGRDQLSVWLAMRDELRCGDRPVGSFVGSEQVPI